MKEGREEKEPSGLPNKPCSHVNPTRPVRLQRLVDLWLYLRETSACLMPELVLFCLVITKSDAESQRYKCRDSADAVGEAKKGEWYVDRLN